MPSIHTATVKRALQQAFPSASITDQVAQEVATAITEGAPASAPGAPDIHSYYVAEATHTRTIGIQSSFIGRLPLVRYRLPLTGNFDSDRVPTVKTAIGNLLPEDRKVASVAMVKTLTGDAQTAERVDLLTPARASGPLGSRFGAFTTYLCYTNADDDQPSWYMLEGGTATGRPMVLYPSEGMNWIVNVGLGYTPTTFSKVTDFVSGLLTMNGDEPSTLEIRVTDTSGQGVETDPNNPYITVKIDYAKQAQPPRNNPVSTILEAAARLGVIGKHLKRDAGWEEDLAAAFGGLELDWLTKPTP